MSIDPKVLSAKNDVEYHRAKMMATVKFAAGEAKRRLAPDLVLSNAWSATKRKSGELAHDAMLEAKSKPLLFGGIAAAVGALLFRKPLGKLASSAYDSVVGHEDADEPAGAPALKPPPRRDRRSTQDAAPTIPEFREPTRPTDEKKTPKPRRAKRPQKVKTEEESNER